MKPQLTLIRGGRYGEPKRPKTLLDCLPPEEKAQPTAPAKRDLPPMQGKQR